MNQPQIRIEMPLLSNDCCQFLSNIILDKTRYEGPLGKKFEMINSPIRVRVKLDLERCIFLVSARETRFNISYIVRSVQEVASVFCGLLSPTSVGSKSDMILSRPRVKLS